MSFSFIELELEQKRQRLKKISGFFFSFKFSNLEVEPKQIKQLNVLYFNCEII